MADPDVIRYIADQTHKGKSSSEIRAELHKAGWPAGEIDQALAAVPQTRIAVSATPGSIPAEIVSLRQDLDVLSSRLAKLEARAGGATAQMPEETSAVSYVSDVSDKSDISDKSDSASGEKESVESKITGKWFAGLGIVAILFGVAFFLKYAFENNLIGVTGRVILGVFAGIALLLTGDFLSKKKTYLQYSFFLSGGGLALLYLSLYGAFALYHLIDQVPAFILLVLVTAAGMVIALKHDSQRLASLALVGGFLTPFLISTGTDNQTALFAYLTLLDLGFLAVSYFRKWHGLYILSFIGTYAIFFSWQATYYEAVKLGPTLFFLSLFYLIFSLAPFLRSLGSKIYSTSADLLLYALNAAFYFSTSYVLLKPEFHDFLGFFFILWAAFAIVCANMLYARRSEDRFGIYGLGGVGLVIASLAVPVQLTGNWITIAWALETLILTWFGFRLRSQSIRVFADIVGIMTILHALSVSFSYVAIETFNPVSNSRFLTLITVAVALFASAYLYRRNATELKTDEVKIAAVFGVVANLIAVFALSLEVTTTFAEERYLLGTHTPSPTLLNPTPYPADQYSSLNNQMNLSLSILWAIYSAGLMVVGIIKRFRSARILAIVGFGLVVLKVFLYDSQELTDLYRILSFIFLGIILLVVSFLFYRYKDKIKQFILA